MLKIEEKSPALTTALQVYCTNNEISTRALADKLEVVYQYAWNLLNGTSPVSTSALGRFLLAYGPQAAQELIDLALSYEKVQEPS